MVLEIVLGIVAFAALVFAALFLYKHKSLIATKYIVAIYQKAHEAVLHDYLALQDKLERIQRGFDQGVLEGTRQAYANVRAFLADEIAKEEPQIQAYLIEWLHPRLAALGQKEHALLLDMKDLAEQEKAFLEANEAKLDADAKAEAEKVIAAVEADIAKIEQDVEHVIPIKIDPVVTSADGEDK